MACFKTGLCGEDVLGLKAGNGMVEVDSIGNLTLRPFINRKLKELVMTSLKISVWRKLKEAEIQNLKESCLGEFGGNCKDADEVRLCSICYLKSDIRELADLFGRRFDHKLEYSYFRKMETVLLGLFKKMTPSPILLLMVDQLEQILLITGLNALRHSINIHCRGLHLGTAAKLDHILNMCEAILPKDVLKECAEFGDIHVSNTTLWNDEKDDLPDFNRSHLLHSESTMSIGFGVNVLQKRGWSGVDMTGFKVTEKDNKKRIRVIKFNDVLNTKFDKPLFDCERGTYDLSNVTWETFEDLKYPLIPSQLKKVMKVHIR